MVCKGGGVWCWLLAVIYAIATVTAATATTTTTTMKNNSSSSSKKQTCPTIFSLSV